MLTGSSGAATVLNRFALCRLHVPLEHVPHFGLVAVGALRGSLKVDLVVGSLVRGSVELDLELLKTVR